MKLRLSITVAWKSEARETRPSEISQRETRRTGGILELSIRPLRESKIYEPLYTG